MSTEELARDLPSFEAHSPFAYVPKDLAGSVACIVKISVLASTAWSRYVEQPRGLSISYIQGTMLAAEESREITETIQSCHNLLIRRRHVRVY